MRSTAFGKQQNPSSVRTFGKASLSVVVVSFGPALLGQRATQALAGAPVDFDAQLILVSQDDDPALAAAVEHAGGEFVAAPPGSTRAEMCDLGMKRANGMIVAVRDDVAVGDAEWLNAYRAVLSVREPYVPVEAVVLDTQVAGRVALADSARSFAAIDPKARAATIDMAAAV
jgi:hypothetical protein